MLPRQTKVMPGAKAPGASQPGMGRGNVPFAGGIMSGNLGGPSRPPLARQAPQRPVQTGKPPSPQPPGQTPPPAGPGGNPGGPPMGGMGGGMGGGPWGASINPMTMLNFLEFYLESLQNSLDNELIGGIY